MGRREWLEGRGVKPLAHRDVRFRPSATNGSVHFLLTAPPTADHEGEQGCCDVTPRNARSAPGMRTVVSLKNGDAARNRPRPQRCTLAHWNLGTLAPLSGLLHPFQQFAEPFDLFAVLRPVTGALGIERALVSATRLGGHALPLRGSGRVRRG